MIYVCVVEGNQVIVASRPLQHPTSVNPAVPEAIGIDRN